jgi:hypothetical protein
MCNDSTRDRPAFLRRDYYLQDPSTPHRQHSHPYDLCHRREPKMTEEGMFLLGIVMGILLDAATKIFTGLIKMSLIGLGLH